MATRGMMADNMFVGKAVLLNWLNSALQLRLEKIEDTCNGAVACQLMDCLHPGSINMKKAGAGCPASGQPLAAVDFNVKNDYEFDKNYKELQLAFTKAGISRAFVVNSLSKGKFQDNNEFMQARLFWFKGYWDEITGGQEITDYDAIGARQRSKTGDWKRFSLGEAAARPATADSIPAVRRGGAAPVAAQRAAAPAAKAPLPRAAGGGGRAGGPPSRSNSTSSSLEVEQHAAQVAELTEQLTELKLKVETVERERDFYFDKLRDIEVLTQAPELADIPIVKTVEAILYAADSTEAKAAMAEAGAKYGATFEPVPAEGEDSAAAAAEQ
eukprot:scaffold19.g1851.t1